MFGVIPANLFTSTNAIRERRGRNILTLGMTTSLRADCGKCGLLGGLGSFQLVAVGQGHMASESRHGIEGAGTFRAAVGSTLFLDRESRMTLSPDHAAYIFL